MRRREAIALAGAFALSSLAARAQPFRGRARRSPRWPHPSEVPGLTHLVGHVSEAQHGFGARLGEGV
jgi:hypothetical protein